MTENKGPLKFKVRFSNLWSLTVHFHDLFLIVYFWNRPFQICFFLNEWPIFSNWCHLDPTEIMFEYIGALSFNEPPPRGRIEMYHRRTGGNSQKQQTVHHKLLTKHKIFGQDSWLRNLRTETGRSKTNKNLVIFCRFMIWHIIFLFFKSIRNKYLFLMINWLQLKWIHSTCGAREQTLIRKSLSVYLSLKLSMNWLSGIRSLAKSNH